MYQTFLLYLTAFIDGMAANHMIMGHVIKGEVEASLILLSTSPFVPLTHGDVISGDTTEESCVIQPKSLNVW